MSKRPKSLDIRLYEKYTTSELVAMEAEFPPLAIDRTPAQRKQATAIRQAIAWHMEDKRKADGDPVPTSGYSGRQTNRR
jgi:hypothetical protein